MAALAQENIWFNKAQCEDAERMYYEKLSGAKRSDAQEVTASTSKTDDDLDLFASDEEAPQEKPVMVKPAKKNKDKKNQKSEKKASEKVWENKAECDDAERKMQEQLAKGGYRNAANGERTFIMLKPDAVHRGLMGTIIERFESRGFKLVAAKLMRASESLLKQHYADLSKKPFFPELIRYMGSGPVVPMVWQGLNAVKQGRAMLGATNPKDSAPGTIRGDFCIDVGRNIIHGSDSVESAQKEIALWFSESELAKWRPIETEWVYEEEELVKGGTAYQVDGLAAQVGTDDMALAQKLSELELENKSLKEMTTKLQSLVLKLEGRVTALEGGKGGAKPTPAPAAAADEDDDDVDLFGSDEEEEDEEKARITAERLKAYAEKKAKKPGVIAKTSVLFDVKPWDDETDMDAMLKAVKSIEMDGLTWGANKLVPVGYGINKLQVMCVVEDEKISIDELSEKITDFEDFVQSVDIAAMNKI